MRSFRSIDSNRKTENLQFPQNASRTLPLFIICFSSLCNSSDSTTFDILQRDEIMQNWKVEHNVGEVFAAEELIVSTWASNMHYYRPWRLGETQYRFRQLSASRAVHVNSFWVIYILACYIVLSERAFQWLWIAEILWRCHITIENVDALQTTRSCIIFRCEIKFLCGKSATHFLMLEIFRVSGKVECEWLSVENLEEPVYRIAKWVRSYTYVLITPFIASLVRLTNFSTKFRFFELSL